jgi:asparagine synthase (glutamine-hydrolysing)
MCGIAGIYASRGHAPVELVHAMVERLAHRGPDGDGYHTEQEVALGMRRLAIVDLAGGGQPLYNERRNVAVVFNGEIYNHRELRTWLEARDHTLSSETDGAVLPHLFEELGPAFVERLNGIFAIAVWDADRQALHLARDRFGVKPLYWAERDGLISFASEIRALLADPALRRDVDLEAVDHFLTFRYMPSPYTPLAAVRKLPPAGTMSCDGDGLELGNYWSAAPTGQRRDRAALIEEYSESFERAVVRQMMSDRPIGVMLSGGVDSGAITAVLARHSSQVRTFTVGFSAGGDTDETSLAAETARRFGASHEHLILGPSDYLDALPRSLEILEEPVGSNSSLAVNFVSELMRPGVPVALCGQGADELMAGYWRHLGLKLSHLARRVPGARLAAQMPGLDRHVRLARGLRTLRAQDDLDLLMTAYRLFRDEDKLRLYRPSTLDRLRDGSRPEATVEHLRGRVAGLDPLAQMLYVDTRLWLPDELLLIADKMSMAASVELRVPFLDQDLVALAESVDSSQKIRGLTRKSLHKEAMLRWLPKEIVHRKERGWNTPAHAWLRSELRPLLEDVLLSDGEVCRELFEEREMRRLVQAHAAGTADHTRLLYALLSLGLCYRGLAARA